ncbi:MAG: cbb3-type cytochrome c oxidase subunit I [Thermodesulfobacteriota bacterium]
MSSHANSWWMKINERGEPMDKFAKSFVKASLIYLAIGAITGFLLIALPDTRFILTRVHTHINLLGFMAMMIYGVGYHILPRFMGRPLYSPRMANIHVWLANMTLIGLSISWILESSIGGIWYILAILFGLGQVISIFIFIINLWNSMKPQQT